MADTKQVADPPKSAAAQTIVQTAGREQSSPAKAANELRITEAPRVVSESSVTPRKIAGEDLIAEPQAPAVTSPPSESTENPSEQAAHQTQVQKKPEVRTEPDLVSAIRCYLERRPAEAVVWLERFEKLNQDLLLHLLPVTVRLTEKPVSQLDARELTILVQELTRIADLLRPRSSLILHKLCFCEKISKFGDYQPLEADHRFRPGELVELYVEIQNFASVRDGSEVGVQLASYFEILDASGNRVYRSGFRGRSHMDRSLSPKHDYFKRYSFQIPSNIPPGLYTLKLQVTDVPTGRNASGSLDFRVALPHS